MTQAETFSDSDFFKSDSLYRHAIKIAQERKNLFIEFVVHYKGEKNAHGWGIIDQANQYFKSAISIAEKLQNDSLKTKALIRLSENHFENGEIESGIKTGFEALDLAKKLNLKELLSDAYSSLAELHRLADQNESSLELNLEALKVAKQSSNEHKWARVYNNIGAVLGDLDRNKEAIDTLKHALTLISDSNLYAKAKYNSNIAFCFRNLEQSDSALIYNKEALRLKKIIKAERTYSYTLGAIGRCYKDIGKYDSALFYTKKAYELAKKYNNTYRLKDAAIHLAEAYYYANEFKNAFDYLEKGRSLEDSIFDVETKEKIDLYKRKYDYSKKEQELDRIKNERLIEEANAKVKTIVLSLTAILAILISFMLALIVKRRNQEKELIQLKLENVQRENTRNSEELKAFTRDLIQKNSSIKKLNAELHEKEKLIESMQFSNAEDFQELAEIKILTDEDWKRFKLLFEKVYPGFFKRVAENEIEFTKGEKRLMALVKLDLSNSEIADTLGISTDSVVKSRFRLKRKIKVEEEQSLNQFIYQI